LPGFLAQLAEQLDAEQHTMMKEVDLLRSSIEHIKDIVAMQQNYARNSGVIDSWIPAQLVEDALRINAAGLTRHGVKVVREFDDVPPIVVDRHKVLQILINLIRNAKYALDEACTGERRLTLRIRESAPGRVGITVRDTGIGIAPELLTRIFAHGFTTKRDGHGFGLHSGANDAREMGGSLSAESDGPGHGATFTLELPSSPNRN
jgi:C4-dicarboxylate-specific signal transduction histidine kinase